MKDSRPKIKLPITFEKTMGPKIFSSSISNACCTYINWTLTTQDQAAWNLPNIVKKSWVVEWKRSVHPLRLCFDIMLYLGVEVKIFFFFFFFPLNEHLGYSVTRYLTLPTRWTANYDDTFWPTWHVLIDVNSLSVYWELIQTNFGCSMNSIHAIINFSWGLIFF